MQAFLTHLLEIDVQKTVHEALQHEKWKEVVLKKINGLEK